MSRKDSSHRRRARRGLLRRQAHRRRKLAVDRTWQGLELFEPRILMNGLPPSVLSADVNGGDPQRSNAGNLFGSSVEIDTDGCTTNANSVFAIPGGWVDTCLAGAPGDFGIRAIVDPIPEPASLALMTLGGTLMCLRRRSVARRGATS